ncbi:MAG: hypothetical protein CVT92_15220 [Bacteroidetes bacterium HGW-Bacteroidetes-1]|jgi:hypothetical protein|nr:MAG: hypothetical protein CVT92_15220 [Bacteroidetes bacterium HGW-Bacteroidetes-1]
MFHTLYNLVIIYVKENIKSLILLIINNINHPFSNEFYFVKLCAFFAKLCVTAISQRDSKKPQRSHRELFLVQNTMFQIIIYF